MSEFNCIAPDVRLGKDVKLSKFINLYGCEIGEDSKIGAFVEMPIGLLLCPREWHDLIPFAD